MQQRVTRILEQRIVEKPSLNELPLLLPATDVKDEVADERPEKSVQPGMFKKHRTEWEAPGDQPRRGLWPRNLLLLLLALLLIGGGSLGFVRAERPCWLGICPQISLSTSAITFTNNESQKIKITNSGTDNLHWQASQSQSYFWLTLSPSSGTLAPGQAAYLTLSTNVDKLSKSEVYTDTIDIQRGIESCRAQDCSD